VRIVDGVALVDLTERVDAGGGSCRKQAIVTQIERTLLQFSTVKKVVLSVNGVSTGIFQP
jgi:spore germination protein GerM